MSRLDLEHAPYDPLPFARNNPGGGQTHGTRSCYIAGCRDECCRRAERLYKRAYRRQKARRAA